ncbi:uncharacterized protein LOC132194856 [Neocloeon triangulifer]|uniref:uncharacterized protein LOC132194856 n=1 Tax=Neocloeon triangulifer TaxID=2078957 RepID=UPI00286FA64B|nr:uncharacterized protein LOC132194856 [Neocloeon triangulifer]
MASFSRVSILKIIELVLTCVLIGLHYHSFEAADLHAHIIISATFGGFLVVLAGIFAGIISGQPMPKRVDMFYSLCGVALFAASGVLTIQYYNNQWITIDKDKKNIGVAKGSIAIINAVIFLLDLVFTFRD